MDKIKRKSDTIILDIDENLIPLSNFLKDKDFHYSKGMVNKFKYIIYLYSKKEKKSLIEYSKNNLTKYNE